MSVTQMHKLKSSIRKEVQGANRSYANGKCFENKNYTNERLDLISVCRENKDQNKR